MARNLPADHSSQETPAAPDPAGQKITAAERSARRREVVRLRYSGMPVRQVAQILGIGLATVHNDEKAHHKELAKRPDYEANRIGLLGRLRYLYDLTLGEASNYLATECAITDDEIRERPGLGPVRAKARAERAAFRVDAYQKAAGFLMDEAKISGQLAILPGKGVGSDPDADNEPGPGGSIVGPVGDEVDAVASIVRLLPLEEQQEFAAAVGRANELFDRARALQSSVSRRVRVEVEAEAVSPEMAEGDR